MEFCSVIQRFYCKMSQKLKTAAIIVLLIGTLFQKNCLPCVFQQNVGNDIKPVTRVVTEECDCGNDFYYEIDEGYSPPIDVQENSPFKSWHLYIHVLDQSEKRNLIRTCTGTLINTKMVLTSTNCLKIGTNKPAIFEKWYIRPKKTEIPLTFANVENVQVSEDSDYSPAGSAYVPAVENVFYVANKLEGRFKDFTDNDVAVLVLKENINTNWFQPICLPKTHKDLDLTGYYGYYYGVGGLLEADPNAEVRFVGNVVVMPAKMCDEALGEPQFFVDGSLCIQYRTLSPSATGGPLVMAIDGQVNKRGYTAGKRVFLIGLASVASKKAAKWKGDIHTTYFTNILPLVPYLEFHAEKLGAKWCNNTPSFQLGSRVDPRKGLQPNREWEGTNPIQRDESLDCVCGLHNLKPSAQGRIVGGVEAIPYEFPWQVLLYFWRKAYPEEKKHPDQNFLGNLCGGSIINDRMILTAAHCVIRNKRLPTYTSEEALANADISVAYIRAHFSGLDDSVDPKREKILIKNIYYPKDYTDEARQNGYYSVPYYDIAILELKAPLKFSTAKNYDKVATEDIRPICLPYYLKNIDTIGKLATVAGWGDTPPDKINTHPAFWGTSDKLLKLDVPILPIKDCVERHYIHIGDDSVICAGYYDRQKDAAKGDSGGPLIIKSDNGYWTQVGIVSYDKSVFEAGEDYDVPGLVDKQPKFKYSLAFYTNVQRYIRFVDFYANKIGAKWCKSYI